ncbi:hypothetical protein [Micromonospora sp. NPDC049204]|uniref:hypothetical protein n=1 Tax=unclassified Micromonospora TaxID=2617518 RepID=UPI0033E073CF
MRQEENGLVDGWVRRAVVPDPAAVVRLTSTEARRVMLEEIVSARDSVVDEDHRSGTKRRAVLVAVAAAAVTGAGVWAVKADDLARPPVANRPTPVDSGLDRYRASDQPFFEALRPSEAMSMVPPPGTLEAAFAKATATVIARVAAVNIGRILHDLQFADVELHVHEVLRGSLRPELNGVVRVEFPAAFLPGDINPVLDRMRSRLPENPAVWLLRWNGEPPPTRKPGAPIQDPTADLSRYKLVHPTCGVFAQGADHVIAATAPSSYPAYRAQKEGEQFALLSELADRARQ